jgi:hypothetical protein
MIAPVLAQKSIRSQSAVDHEVGHAQKVSILGIRSPVIVTIESPDLDRRLDMGAALRNEWKGTDVAERTARLSLWLRPRDVRSGDVAHRPREMRRSCQLKAAGCGGNPDSLYVVTDAFCSCDNNENNKTKLDGGASH